MTESDRALSPWLRKFMSSERGEIQEIEQAPLDDHFVSEFAARCTNTEKAKLALLPEAELEPEEESKDSISYADIKEVAKGEKMVFVHNLAYNITEERLRKEVAAFGKVSEVTMPTMQDGPNIGKFAGYALVSFEDEISAADCVAQFNNQYLMGRQVRVRFNEKLFSKEKKSGSTQPIRYFDASDQRKINPCYFCAAEGHLPNNCPDRICTKCLRVGHEASKCHERSSTDNTLCTNCGRWGHKWQWCTETDGYSRLSKGARCVICAEFDHLDCSEHKLSTTKAVFCSWCARQGHTQPSCPKAALDSHPSKKKRRRAASDGDLFSLIPHDVDDTALRPGRPKKRKASTDILSQSPQEKTSSKKHSFDNNNDDDDTEGRRKNDEGTSRKKKKKKKKKSKEVSVASSRKSY